MKYEKFDVKRKNTRIIKHKAYSRRPRKVAMPVDLDGLMKV